MRCLKKGSLFRDILGIFFLALLIRVVISAYTHGLLQPEVWEYEDIAFNLYKGKGFVMKFIGVDYYAYATPLYPLLCALVYKIAGHNLTFIILTQIIISSLLCVVVYLIAIDIFDRRTALLSSFLTAFHPGLIIYSSLKLHAFTLDAFLISMTIYCFIRVREKINSKGAFICGVTFGLCSLTRVTIIPFLLIGIIWLFWIGRAELRKALKYSLILLITGVFLIGLWSFRNFLVFKRFIPITTVSAENFWRGNNIYATGTGFTRYGDEVLKADKEFFVKITSFDEIQRYDLFKSEAIKFIKSHPKKFLFLFSKKLYYFWWFSPDSGKFYPAEYFGLYKCFYLLMLLFSLVGIFSVVFERNQVILEKASLIIAAILIISIVQSFFYVEGRHRLAIEPILLIFFAKCLFFIKEKLICLRMKI